MSTSPNPIVLYDGVCGLCNRFVQFILKRDKTDCFRFAALQSEVAKKILDQHGLSADELDTVYLVEHYRQPDESLLNRSDAAIAVGTGLGGWWRFWAAIFRFLPRALRNWAYNRIAGSRYKIFGKYDACPLPDPRDQHKFLDQSPVTRRL